MPGSGCPQAWGAQQGPPCRWSLWTSGRWTKGWSLPPRQGQAAETHRTHPCLRPTHRAAFTAQAGGWVGRPLQEAPSPGLPLPVPPVPGLRPPEAQPGAAASPQRLLLGLCHVLTSWEIWGDWQVLGLEGSRDTARRPPWSAHHRPLSGGCCLDAASVLPQFMPGATCLQLSCLLQAGFPDLPFTGYASFFGV